MRDGTVLRADLYRPSDGNAHHPLLMQRTPYGKEQAALANLTLDPIRAARAGYAVLIQDVRGRNASEGGPFDAYRHELADSHDTAEWAARARGSNGIVGAYGLSYTGATAWCAAATAPSRLRAISAMTAPYQLWDNHFWRGGALHLGLLSHWVSAVLGPGELRRIGGSAEDLSRLADDIDSYAEHVRHQPVTDYPTVNRHLPGSTPFFLDALTRTRQRGSATSPALLDGYHRHITAPALIVAGWHDALLAGDLSHYRAMRETAATERARSSSRLVVGPWSHAMFGAVVGEVDFGMRASGSSLDLREDLTTMQLRWFDRHLKGQDNGIDEEAPVRIFVQGRNRWRDEEDWPLARAQPTRLHLRSGNLASFAAPEPNELPDDFVYDPTDPCPTRGGSLLMPAQYPRGPVDQTPILRRSDVLSYTTGPLTEDLEVTGPITAVVWAATDGPDTDWVVKLCDVHPDGRTFNVCDGIVRASRRNGMDVVEPVPANEPLRYEVDMWATSMVFLAGHRLRVLITSSDFPRYDRNPNTGGSSIHAPIGRAAHQRIFHDQERSTYVLLPIVSH
ncbi:CocE/NonD family hydrolase [Nocardia salmonicida]|uniref:CocE/NonD family hydrolase n=1 Tax=Nocardia salmonicida TaxID=53431 RepID=UPI0033ECB307